MSRSQRRALTAGSSLPVLAVTAGEPAGIGPDICLALAGRDFSAHFVVLCDRELLAQRARELGLGVKLRDFLPGSWGRPGEIDVMHMPLAAPCRAGKLDPANAPYVLALIERAMSGCRSGEFNAMVTAPVHKGVINDAGIPFTGHTEYLDEKSGAGGVVMMLVGAGMRVALATTHLPLAQVPRAITPQGLERTLRIIVSDLRRRFGIAAPRILVAALNPHAGEGGHLGREEIDIIAPLIARLQSEGSHIEGPIPADTLFVPSRLQGADCALAMYHDQGLPVLKYASFGGGVNVTLGLPFIRTSVDHGTALDLAGKPGAEAGSLFAAIELAVSMVAATAASGAAADRDNA